MKWLLKWGIPLIVVSMPNFCLAQNSDAYRLRGNAILVDRASLWGNWIYQNELVTSLNVPGPGSGYLRGRGRWNASGVFPPQYQCWPHG